MALFFCLLSGLGLAQKKPQTVLQGEVHVASTDPQGNVLTVEIMVGEGNDPEPYLVAEGPQSNELKKHVGEQVVVGGTVSEDKLGWKTITVKTFTMVDFHFPDK